jgi:hypothetical protein
MKFKVERITFLNGEKMCNNISDQLKYYSFLNDWDLIVVGVFII